MFLKIVLACSLLLTTVVESYAEVKKWQTQPWTADDKPYVAIRQQVDKEFYTGASTQNMKRRYALYKKLAQQKPTDPKAVFRFAYATYSGLGVIGTDVSTASKGVSGRLCKRALN